MWSSDMGRLASPRQPVAWMAGRGVALCPWAGLCILLPSLSCTGTRSPGSSPVPTHLLEALLCPPGTSGLHWCPILDSSLIVSPAFLHDFIHLGICDVPRLAGRRGRGGRLEG